jgi:hypothetical protein
MKVIPNPSNEVILENTFDELVQEVRGEQLVNVGTGKVVGEWLKSISFGSIRA